VRSLERLVETGRVVQAKAPPTGKRGRPAFVYRPTTEAVEPDTDTGTLVGG
jgi:predicted transcriptional regulator